ncbi:MAG: DegT/DnrJ/EryC1/StrS family aminotransferase [Chloroflexota bacterium]
MEIPLVDLKAQYASIKPEIDTAIQRVVDNTSFILGQEVQAFEAAFAAYLGVRGAVGVASGTAALHLSLLACGVGQDDEVITTAHTFFATAEAISVTRARPVFVDIDPQTYLIDPQQVEQAITSRTKAVIPVHLYGQPADMEALSDICSRHKLWLIEDAAQAHGAKFAKRMCGSIGHLGCFSFYPGKNLGCFGDGGMVTSNDPDLLAKVRKLRDHGRTTKYEHDEIGWGYRLDALQAAILGVKLGYLDKWNTSRRKHAWEYTQLLKDVEIVTPIELPDRFHVYHLYVIRTPRRDEMITHLKERGINAGIHYPLPLHRQPAYLSQGYGEVQLPVSEQVCREVISLPLYPELTGTQIKYIVESIKEVAS